MGSVRRVWHNLPLGTKLAGLISLLVMAVVLALTFLNVRREQASFQQELEDQASLLLETLPLTMRDQLYRQELDELMDIARVVSSNDNVTSFVVYDSQGAILVDAALPDPVFSQTVDPLGQTLINSSQLNQPNQPQILLDWRPDQLVAGRAISLGNQPIGAVTVGLSTAPLDTKIAALTRQSVLLALVTLVVGSGLAFLLARQITNPLNELTDVTAQMTGGDRFARVQMRSADEVGQLGDAFNQMADAIQKREAELRDLAAGLERTVAARTAELRQQNQTLVQTNEELIVARREAEAADRAKSAFLSVVSHELRTPLTSVLGFAKLIQRRLRQVIFAAVTDDDPRVRRAIKQVDENIGVIVSEGERLTMLINDLLDLAKIEAGKVEWNMRPLAVQEVIDRSVAATASLFEHKPVEMAIDVAADLPEVVGDRDRLIQVVVNLISNAAKFTDEGAVTCRASLSGENVLVSVIDTGIGIVPEDHDEVFEQFVQVGDALTNKPQGTGLGLPICKNIVEHHGGRIWVESEGLPGKGSRFSFTLPFASP